MLHLLLLFPHLDVTSMILIPESDMHLYRDLDLARAAFAIRVSLERIPETVPLPHLGSEFPWKSDAIDDILVLTSAHLRQYKEWLQDLELHPPLQVSFDCDDEAESAIQDSFSVLGGRSVPFKERLVLLPGVHIESRERVSLIVDESPARQLSLESLKLEVWRSHFWPHPNMAQVLGLYDFPSATVLVTSGPHGTTLNRLWAFWGMLRWPDPLYVTYDGYWEARVQRAARSLFEALYNLHTRAKMGCLCVAPSSLLLQGDSVVLIPGLLTTAFEDQFQPVQIDAIPESDPRLNPDTYTYLPQHIIQQLKNGEPFLPAAADVYGTGIVLWEYVHQRPPYMASGEVRVARYAMSDLLAHFLLSLIDTMSISDAETALRHPFMHAEESVLRSQADKNRNDNEAVERSMLPLEFADKPYQNIWNRDVLEDVRRLRSASSSTADSPKEGKDEDQIDNDGFTQAMEAVYVEQSKARVRIDNMLDREVY